MKIFSILTLKDEVDIVQYTVEKALEWSDYIFIIDNMSTDGSWELLNEKYKDNPQVIIWGQYGGEFRDAVRQLVFNQYRNMMQYGDWICRLDADEEYIDEPKAFLALLPVECDHVYSQSFQFYYTEKDYEFEMINGYQRFDNRLKYYLPNHSEIRFVKYTRYAYWLQNQDWPEDCLLYPAKENIRLKHYQYRSLLQMKKRFENRNAHPAPHFFSHEREDLDIWYKKNFNYNPLPFELKYRIVPSHLLIYDNADYQIYSHNHSHPKMIMRLVKKVRAFIYKQLYEKLNRYKY